MSAQAAARGFLVLPDMAGPRVPQPGSTHTRRRAPGAVTPAPPFLDGLTHHGLGQAAPSSAARRSPTRASGDSRPTERRINSAGGATGEPAPDAGALLSGWGMSGSTPPPDSQRFKGR